MGLRGPRRGPRDQEHQIQNFTGHQEASFTTQVESFSITVRQVLLVKEMKQPRITAWKVYNVHVSLSLYRFVCTLHCPSASPGRTS